MTLTTRILELTDATFDETISASKTPVLVDFWAEWCGPCKMLSPVLDEIAGEYADRLLVTKLNADENPEVPRRFNAMSLPTLLLFQDGELVKRLVGARGKGLLLEELSEFLV